MSQRPTGDGVYRPPDGRRRYLTTFIARADIIKCPFKHGSSVDATSEADKLKKLRYLLIRFNVFILKYFFML